jgi:hypothetical protein
MSASWMSDEELSMIASENKHFSSSNRLDVLVLRLSQGQKWIFIYFFHFERFYFRRSRFIYIA